MEWVPEPPAMTLGASRVELRVSCHGLLDRDTLAKPHPCVLLKLYSDEQWVEVRATQAWKEGGWVEATKASRGKLRTLRGLFQAVWVPWCLKVCHRYKRKSLIVSKAQSYRGA